jgi:hypothetical protein
MINENIDHIRGFFMAKEAWNNLDNLNKGNMIIQRSKVTILQQEVHEFVMNDDATFESLLRRLVSLTVEITMMGGSRSSFSKP